MEFVPLHSESVRWLPPEMLVEILIRLPSKYILRYLNVCKSWRSLITHPYFISFHRRHSRPSFFLIQFQSHSDPSYQISFRRNDPNLSTLASVLRLTSPFNCFSHVISICHGILCIRTWDLQDFECHYAICNPSIRRLHFVPKPQPVPQPEQDHSSTVALGFDSRNRHYKIVRIAYGKLQGYHISSSRVEVYTIESGLWRTLLLPPLLAPPFIISSPGRFPSHGYVNGLVHWGAMRTVGVGEEQYHYLFVLSFDFVREVFCEIMLPQCLARASSDEVFVSVVGSSDEKALTVCHVDDLSPTSGTIWVMNEYGVVDSWTKLYAFDRLSLEEGMTINFMPPTALFDRYNGQILLPLYKPEKENGPLCLLDLENNRPVNLQIGPHDYLWWSLMVHYYAESLVLVNFAGIAYDCVYGFQVSSGLSRRYFESRRTALEMLHDRGYIVPDSDLTLSLYEFRSRFGEQPDPKTLGFCVSHSSHSNKAQVVFTGTDDIRRGTIDEILNQIEDKEALKSLILIVQSKMTSFAQKDLQNCPFKVEIMKISDMLVNITKHGLQPRYEVLTTEEKEALLKYNVEGKQLPHMLTTDAIARYYGWEKGQVIKVTHSGGMVDSFVTHRFVV